MRETVPSRSGIDRAQLFQRGRNMAGTIEQKLAALDVVLHQPPNPVANYVGFVRSGNLLFVSGQVCVDPHGKLIAKGKLGAGVTAEQGNAAARGCAINLLAQVKAALGDLDKFPPFPLPP
ncbi:MAG TPA: RidA family protein, partial [Steroidobacteraceae bacterium]|nr:RidA family protein [Steroidobacteraceae bacterium]